MIAVPEKSPLPIDRLVSSNINRVRLTYEMFHYSWLHMFDVEGKPFTDYGEITSMELDPEHRFIDVYFKGPIDRAEGQEIPRLSMTLNMERAKAWAQRILDCD